MKTFKILALANCVLFAGCFSSKSPYDYVENWLIREDPVRTFVIPADVIYVQNDLYTNVKNVPLMFTYAQSEVGNGKFDGLARVFSPLIANADDLEKALDWYFKYHHKSGRSFVFIGEGVGGSLLRAYEEADADDLKDDGLVASFYTDEARKGFVTEEMVKEIRQAVYRARYRAVWDREMPEDMLKE